MLQASDQDHFFNIKLKPEFNKIYSSYFNKFNDPLVLATKVIRKHLIESEIKFQMSFTPEEYIYKPLKDYPDVYDAFHYLISKGYFNKFAGQVSFTSEGWNWLHGQNKSVTRMQKDGNIKFYNFFNIPNNCAEKIKKLLQEINSLPEEHINIYPNLIAHQLRTILGLILIDYWNTNDFKKETKGSLKEMIAYTIKNASAQQLTEARRVVSELVSINSSKIKDLIDDVVHCDFTLLNHSEIQLFQTQIKHLVSLVYGR